LDKIPLFILLGLGPGALTAGIALAVVVTYRGSGMINLATGAMAMLSGYSYWALRTGELGPELGAGPALIVTLVITLAVGALTEVVVYRPLRNAAPLAKLVASLGVLLVAQASMLLAFGNTQQPQPAVLPRGTIEVFGSKVPMDRFMLAGAVIAMTIMLVMLYRFTRFGLATRAASENELAAMLSGLSANELAMTNTLLASLVAGTMGILAASVAQLDTTTLPLAVVPALAAALLARLRSFGVACAAGLGIGIINSLIDLAKTTDWFPTSNGLALPGTNELIALLLIVLAMFWRGSSLPGRGELVEEGLPAAPRAKRILFPAVVMTVICGVALVVFPFGFRQALINTLIGTVMALSLVAITGFVGQISVAQLSLAGAAGFVVSHFAQDFGIEFPWAPLVGAVVAVLLGELIGVSALRVRGVSLAVVTLAAAVAIDAFGFKNPVWGGQAQGSPVPSPSLLGFGFGPQAAFRGIDDSLPSPVFGWYVLAVTIALCALVAAVRRGRFGKEMLAVRSNERAASGSGINVRKVKLIAFGLSSFIAGVAGSLYAYNFGSVSAGRFAAITALALIAFAYVGGITLVAGAAVAGLISPRGLLPHALETWFGLSGNWFLLFGGVILIVTLLQHPEGIAGTLYHQIFGSRPDKGSAVPAEALP
jgi:branched-chain amino acid transport system permease protein